jgi:hypothetical protein
MGDQKDIYLLDPLVFLFKPYIPLDTYIHTYIHTYICTHILYLLLLLVCYRGLYIFVATRLYLDISLCEKKQVYAELKLTY